MTRHSLKQMVERVPWMSPIHYEILGFFEDHDIRISPKGLAINIGYDRQYTSKECRTLLSAGLLKQDDSLYFLSDNGRAFLDGEIDADEIEEPD